MAGRPGRRPKPTSIEPELLDATRSGLLRAAKQLKLPSKPYLNPDGRRATRHRALDLASLAVEMQDALELIAAEEVNRARDHDGVTWQDVGDFLGTTLQSAHGRFR